MIRKRTRPPLLTLGLSVALVILGAFSLTVGYAPISFVESLASLFRNPDSDRIALIIQAIRLPRLVVGVIVGASLGMAGAALQGLLRNPLADPGIIGVSASAGLGAVIAIYFGAATGSIYAVPGFAMVGALISTTLLYGLARKDTSVMTLILVGIGLSSLAGALTSLAMNLSHSPFSLSDMVLWLLGSLSNRSFTEVVMALPFMVVGWICLLSNASALRGLSLGEETASTMGINLFRLRAMVVLGSALTVGAGVAISGAIGFIGLIVPHIIRPFVGHDPARLLLPSALGGALLLTLADIGVRLAPTDWELKIGVLTALIGSPFFLFLVIKMRREMR
jgi:iron complex transport system permease protein